MRLITLFLCLAPLLSSAQDTARRTCRILFLNGPDNAPQTLQLFDGTSAQEVELPRMNFSKVYRIAPGAVTLHLLPHAPAKPGEIPAGAPKVAVPAEMTDCYLLLVPDSSNAVAPVRLQVIDAGTAKFAKGQMLWFNLSDKSVGGVVGRQELAMAPGSRKTVDAPATSNEDYKVNLNFRIKDDPALHPLCETKWRHNPNSRTVLFVINEPGTRTPRVLGFPDSRAAEPAP